jgi:hypothetical protein
MEYDIIGDLLAICPGRTVYSLFQQAYGFEALERYDAYKRNPHHIEEEMYRFCEEELKHMERWWARHTNRQLRLELA